MTGRRGQGTSPITQVAVHPRGDLVVSAGADRQLRLWVPWPQRNSGADGLPWGDQAITFQRSSTGGPEDLRA
eukprot:Skav233975  [mRNA]  locus=scaffold1008:668031:668246:+ [translate_table: standard]